MKQINNLFLFYGGEFSNFYNSKFTLDNIEFDNSEQYFMHQKALFFNDNEIASKILKATTPAKCKYLGREIKNFSDSKWATVRYDMMLTGCRAKFTQNNRLKNILINTDNLIIVEASPTDKIWGVGLAIDDKDILHIERWKGQNLLGKVLMNLREEFTTL